MLYLIVWCCSNLYIPCVTGDSWVVEEFQMLPPEEQPSLSKRNLKLLLEAQRESDGSAQSSSSSSSRSSTSPVLTRRYHYYKLSISFTFEICQIKLFLYSCWFFKTCIVMVHTVLAVVNAADMKWW